MLNAFYKNAKRLVRATYIDFDRSIKLWRYWLYRSFVRYKLEFQSTRLGLLWPILALLAVVAVLGSLWNLILERTDGLEFYLYLLVGLPTWSVISESINKGSVGLLNKTPGDGMPFTLFLFETLSSIFIRYANVFPVMVSGLFLSSTTSFHHLIYLPLALITLTLWIAGVVMMLSVVTTLLPDISQLIKAFMRFSFLATPVIWQTSRLGEYEKYIWLNPFFAPLEFTRYSLSGILNVPDVAWVAPIYSVLVFLVGLLLFARYLNVLKFRSAK